jgi:hypothetical protein
MKFWLTDFAQLVAANGGGSLATNLFTGQLPAELDAAALATLLFPSGGSGGDEVGVELRNLQITHRCRTFATAWDEAQRLYGVLRGLAWPLRLGSDPDYTLVQQLNVISPPAALGLDENRCWRITTNFELELLAF